jgi:hypothetical protein
MVVVALLTRDEARVEEIREDANRSAAEPFMIAGLRELDRNGKQ